MKSKKYIITAVIAIVAVIALVATVVFVSNENKKKDALANFETATSTLEAKIEEATEIRDVTTNAAVIKMFEENGITTENFNQENFDAVTATEIDFATNTVDLTQIYLAPSSKTDIEDALSLLDGRILDAERILNESTTVVDPSVTELEKLTEAQTWQIENLDSEINSVNIRVTNLESSILEAQITQLNNSVLEAQYNLGIAIQDAQATVVEAKADTTTPVDVTALESQIEASQALTGTMFSTYGDTQTVTKSLGELTEKIDKQTAELVAAIAAVKEAQVAAQDALAAAELATQQGNGSSNTGTGSGSGSSYNPPSKESSGSGSVSRPPSGGGSNSGSGGGSTTTPKPPTGGGGSNSGGDGNYDGSGEICMKTVGPKTYIINCDTGAIIKDITP